MTECPESDDEPPHEEKIERSNNLCTNVEKIEDDKFTERLSKRKRTNNKTKLKPKVMNWQPSFKKRPLSLLEKVSDSKSFCTSSVIVLLKHYCYND